MNIIKTIDLWTEQHDNHYECFNGAFVDGFEDNKIPFNRYKVIKNCNCIITVDNPNLNIHNKHNAIIFYKDNIPVRLVVANKNTDLDKCINIALEQYFGKFILKDYYEKYNITSTVCDRREKPICKKEDNTKEEIDVGSCDRWRLLYNMMRGSYTESGTSYGNFGSDRYEFIPQI